MEGAEGRKREAKRGTESKSKEGGREKTRAKRDRRQDRGEEN